MNKAAQTLGRMGKGKKKTLCPAEVKRRQAWAKGLAVLRWRNKGACASMKACEQVKKCEHSLRLSASVAVGSAGSRGLQRSPRQNGVNSPAKARLQGGQKREKKSC